MQSEASAAPALKRPQSQCLQGPCEVAPGPNDALGAGAVLEGGGPGADSRSSPADVSWGWDSIRERRQQALDGGWGTHCQEKWSQGAWQEAWAPLGTGSSLGRLESP